VKPLGVSKTHMRVVIESLNRDEVRHIGFTPMPAYRVVFSSGTLRAGAWFVPAAEDVSTLVGQTGDVELNQERVSALTRVSPSEPCGHVFSPMPEFGCFQVRGQVVSATPRSELGGEPFAFVRAADAYIALVSNELAGLGLTEGDCVAFCMHDVSLWDEAL